MVAFGCLVFCKEGNDIRILRVLKELYRCFPLQWYRKRCVVKISVLSA